MGPRLSLGLPSLVGCCDIVASPALSRLGVRNGLAEAARSADVLLPVEKADRSEERTDPTAEETEAVSKTDCGEVSSTGEEPGVAMTGEEEAVAMARGK